MKQMAPILLFHFMTGSSLLAFLKNVRRTLPPRAAYFARGAHCMNYASRPAVILLGESANRHIQVRFTTFRIILKSRRRHRARPREGLRRLRHRDEETVRVPGVRNPREAYRGKLA